MNIDAYLDDEKYHIYSYLMEQNSRLPVCIAAPVSRYALSRSRFQK